MSLDNKVKKQGFIRKSRMARIDNLMSVLFLVMACVTRFYHVHIPPEVVFDEVHFGKFASYYIRRTFYFDVHPPLGRLLLALVSWSFGYDGHFNFTTIGESYIENNVPFLVFRGWTAFCGSLLVVFVYRMLRKMGYTIGAVAATLAVVFDNALVTQSRFILLDSMLMMFVTFTLYAWVSFYKERSRAFSFSWYKWLLLTGIGLGCTMGVKMVGLFTVATVGIATIRDLWDLLDTRRKLSFQEWTNHLYARILCLIIIPIFLYLSFFYAHFLVLTKTGPGDNFMSPRFQTTLQGSKMSGDANIVYYGGTVHLKHTEHSCYLHSHLHNYPLKYEDARISSQGQQVTCYGHDDANNAFLILPATNDPNIVSKYTKAIAPVPVNDKDFIMLYHTATSCFLITHDVASPLTPTNTEFTCIKDFNKYQNMVFQLNLEKSNVLKTLGVTFKMIHNETKVAMFANSKKLPEWAFEQQEINGNKKLEAKDNLWMVEHVSNSLNFTTQPPPDEPNTDIPGFFEKFFELHSRMISSNSKLTKSHPYQSEPWEWFVLHRGISFWQSKSDKQQVYLIGNFFTWWIASALVIVYLALLVLHLLAQKRGVNLFNSYIGHSLEYSISFLLIGYLFHYIPFWMMGRSKFLHHYMPALIIKYCLYGCVFEIMMNLLVIPGNLLIWQALTDKPLLNDHQNGFMVLAQTINPTTYIQSPRLKKGIIVTVMGLMLVGTVSAYLYMAPMTYALPLTAEEIKNRKVLGSWDFQYSAK